MPTTETLLPVERLAILVRILCGAIGGQILGRVFWGRIPAPLALLLTERLKTIRDRFASLAARIVAGTYTARRYAPRPTQIAAKPPRETPFRQKFGWLGPLLPEAAQHRSHLLALFQEPEMLALIAAAPAPMARLLRPLFWMLKLQPPPVLANYRRRAGTPPPAAAAYRPPPPAPAPPNTLGLQLVQLAPGAPPKPA